MSPQNNAEFFPIITIQKEAKTFVEFVNLRVEFLRFYVEGGFTFRHFQKRAGFGSPNYLKLVMDGERNLAPRSLGKFLKGLYIAPADEAFVRELFRKDFLERAYRDMGPTSGEAA